VVDALRHHGARTPRGRRPNGDTPAAASPSRADLGVSPHWRYALRHCGHHDDVRGVAPVARRPPSR